MRPSDEAGRRVAVATTLGLALTLGGCGFYGGARDVEEPLPIPAAYSASGGEVTPTGPEPELDHRWWESMADPALEGLVLQAMQANTDLRVVRARVEQARALARRAGALRSPIVNGQLGASISRNIGFAGSSDSRSLSASLPVAYEIDLFARYANRARAAHLDARAAELDAQSFSISLSAQVAETWYDLVDARARQQLIEGQLATNETFLELVMLRFRQGMSPAVDVHQQRLQVTSSRSQIAAVEGRRQLFEQQLALLLGAPPGGIDAPIVDALPTLPPAPAPGVPGNLVAQRPDLRAAERRVQAADRRVSAAIADRLPSITLQFTPGYSYSHIESELFNNTASGFVYNLGASLNVPIFDGGLRRAGVDLERSRVEEATATYADVLLAALVEVEASIVLERQQRLQIVQLEAQVEISIESLRASRDRYRAGLSDFLPVLTALRSKQLTEQALLTARRQLLSNRIQLHRALGGTWPEGLATADDADGRQDG